MASVRHPIKRSIRLPVRLCDGKLELAYGGRLQLRQPECLGELIVPAKAVKQADILEWLQKGRTVEILPEGSTVLLGLNPSGISREHLGKATGPDKLSPPIIDGHGLVFFEVKLHEPLRLLLRGNKRAVLCKCKCSVPILGSVEATSLNHAYTLISAAFEPGRVSHNANVFRRGRCLEDGHWATLLDVRTRYEARFEHELAFASRWASLAAAVESGAGRSAADSPGAGPEECLSGFFRVNNEKLFQLLRDYLARNGGEVLHVAEDYIRKVTPAAAPNADDPSDDRSEECLSGLALDSMHATDLSKEDLLATTQRLLLAVRGYVFAAFDLEDREGAAVVALANEILGEMLETIGPASG